MSTAEELLEVCYQAAEYGTKEDWQDFCARLRAWRLEPRAPSPTNLWQPIETAPLDGTSLLLWNGNVMGIAHWNAFQEGGGFWLTDEDGITFEGCTHWMRLPAPPTG